MTKQLRQTILPTHILGAAGTAESDALGYFSLVAGSGITLTPASGSLTIAATGSGTVTSVGLSLPNVFTVSGSPVTGSGTLTATLATQAANQVFVGPSTGANAAPTFRALLPDDIPTLSTDKLTSGTLPSARGGTGITSLGAGIATFLGTPSSANLAAAVTDKTGTGALVFAAAPSLTGTVNAENLTLSGNLTVNGTTAIRTDLAISNTATGGGTYTLQLSDIDRVILASSITISIPTDATLNFPVGTRIWIYNNGTAAGFGSVSISAATPGTTTVTGGDSGGLPGQGLALIYKVAANTWSRQYFVSGAINVGSGTVTTLQGTSASFQRYALSSLTTISGTSHTLVSTNNGAVLRFTSASAVTVTIPTGLGAAFSCSIIQEGTGQVTITPDAGVTRNAFGGATKTAGQYAVATLIATAANTFILGGQVVV